MINHHYPPWFLTTSETSAAAPAEARRLGAGATLRGSRREAAPAAPSGVATADSAAAGRGAGGTAGGVLLNLGEKPKSLTDVLKLGNELKFHDVEMELKSLNLGKLSSGAVWMIKKNMFQPL